MKDGGVMWEGGVIENVDGMGKVEIWVGGVGWG